MTEASHEPYQETEDPDELFSRALEERTSRYQDDQTRLRIEFDEDVIALAWEHREVSDKARVRLEHFRAQAPGLVERVIAKRMTKPDVPDAKPE